MNCKELLERNFSKETELNAKKLGFYNAKQMFYSHHINSSLCFNIDNVALVLIDKNNFVSIGFFKEPTTQELFHFMKELKKLANIFLQTREYFYLKVLRTNKRRIIDCFKNKRLIKRERNYDLYIMEN